ncbi:MAG: hypothetical protein HPY66_1717 [Firmicutes bacterium]|nr:hypothetical protein [Bacillota bacterium]
MELEEGYTSRGFKIIHFQDLYGSRCSIQKSSLATDDAIWFGVDDADPKIMASKVQENGVGWVKYPIPEDVLLATRMHLTREQAKQLLPILQEFVETGELF